YYFLKEELPTRPSPSAPQVSEPRSDASFHQDRQPSKEERPAANGAAFPVEAIRKDFPILHQQVNGHPLIWLDNAATAQKPRAVIDAISHYYERDNSNVHRGAHALAARATDAYEGGRARVQAFLGANTREEIVFVRGTTEGINLVAQSWGRANLKPGDEIVLTEMEHHANIVPWQFVCKETGAVIRVAPFDDRGEIILEEYAKLLGSRTKLVGMPHVSNVLGTVLPVTLMASMAHSVGARVLVDGAQAVPHLRPNMQALGCDFYVFSGHKLFGPTGVGALYARAPLLDEMPPWQGGGSMIKDVTFEESTFVGPPGKFEAGTPIISGAVGLGAAIDYINKIGFEAAVEHEHALTRYGMKLLAGIPRLRLIGTSDTKVSVLSFVLQGTDPQEVAKFLDQRGIAVRGGHHCAQPTHRHFGLEGSVRPSLAFYNTREEVERLAAVVAEAAGALKRL
ncbi:MAG TPA: cysteine desulfurase, partial [Chloroflexota bacterium]|nr:cysteine desulfurase [Chloroflexota bacterium]